MVFLFFSHFAFIEISRGEHRLEGGGMKTEEADILDIYQERPVRLTARALVPVKEHPKVRDDDKMTLCIVSVQCTLSTAEPIDNFCPDTS